MRRRNVVRLLVLGVPTLGLAACTSKRPGAGVRAHLDRAFAKGLPEDLPAFREALYGALRSAGHWRSEFDLVRRHPLLGAFDQDSVFTRDLTPASVTHIVAALNRDLDRPGDWSSALWVVFFQDTVRRSLVEAALTHFERSDRPRRPDVGLQNLASALQAYAEVPGSLPPLDTRRLLKRIDGLVATYRASDLGLEMGGAHIHAADLLREMLPAGGVLPGPEDRFVRAV